MIAFLNTLRGRWPAPEPLPFVIIKPRPAAAGKATK